MANHTRKVRMTEETKEKTNSDKIEASVKNVSPGIDIEYAQLVANLDLKGLNDDEVEKLYAECRKAQSRRMVRELGY